MQPNAFNAPAGTPAARTTRRPASRTRLCLGAVLLAAALLPAAQANGVGENGHWNFQTRTDKVNQAALQDMIQKRENGLYAAPVYTTNIDKQINCAVTATATGNSNTASAMANSPSTSGSQSSALGNSSSNSNGADGTGSNSASSSQTNRGSVGSSVNGGTSTQVTGWATQALNSEQGNTGAQTASVNTSSGCRFGTLN